MTILLCTIHTSHLSALHLYVTVLHHNILLWSFVHALGWSHVAKYLLKDHWFCQSVFIPVLIAWCWVIPWCTHRPHFTSTCFPFVHTPTLMDVIVLHHKSWMSSWKRNKLFSGTYILVCYHNSLFSLSCLPRWHHDLCTSGEEIGVMGLIRESIDSLCRDGTDAQYMQYLSTSRITSPQTC